MLNPLSAAKQKMAIPKTTRMTAAIGNNTWKREATVCRTKRCPYSPFLHEVVKRAPELVCRGDHLRTLHRLHNHVFIQLNKLFELPVDRFVVLEFGDTRSCVYSPPEIGQ